MVPTNPEDEMAKEAKILGAILAEVTEVLVKHKVGRELGEKVVANLMLHIYMGLPPGTEQKWVNYYVAILLKMFTDALPKKRDNDAAQQGINQFMKQQAMGQ